MNSDTNTDMNNNSDTNSEKDINTNYNSNNTNNTDNHHRFVTLQSSPSLEDFTNTVSFTSLNVRNANNQTKFKTILEDLTERSFLVISLQETRIKAESAVLFKNF